ncbi:organic solute transporter subunit beta [Rhineura floridana]|uniref:organic solute transporter subunit beta n=1 Tax=Rhineura floridana TaxID=261503 RepID=UPI002AC82D01|nr:organic solute transporter subunit beta [Rhineura floridana]
MTVVANEREGTLLAMSSLHPQDDSKSSPNLEADGISPEMLQELLWFFRKDDPSTWNYCILGLSVLVLLVGMVLLGRNVMANRARKRKEGYEASQPDETETKQAFVSLKEDGNSVPLAENLLPQAENAGQVMIQWKDGNITALFADTPEEDI